VWFFRIFVAGVLFLYGGAVLPVEYRMGKVKFVFLAEERCRLMKIRLLRVRICFSS